MLDKYFVSLFDIDYDTFTEGEADGINIMLLKPKSLFTFNDHQLGCLKYEKYHLELNNTTPVNRDIDHCTLTYETRYINNYRQCYRVE